LSALLLISAERDANVIAKIQKNDDAEEGLDMFLTEVLE
jgi:hypothetical protein